MVLSLKNSGLTESGITELKEADRIGTAISYQCASTSLRKFTGDKEEAFEYFTKNKLEQYKTWMQTGNNSCSDTTVGMYLRELRMLFNRAKEIGVTTQYPFIKGWGGYNIPKGKGKKIALNKPELQKIFDFNLTEKHTYSFYLDMWKLMYLIGGPNPTDICLLRESNIKNGFIYFFREKTKRTSNEPKEIQVLYSDQVIPPHLTSRTYLNYGLSIYLVRNCRRMMKLFIPPIPIKLKNLYLTIKTHKRPNNDINIRIFTADYSRGTE